MNEAEIMMAAARLEVAGPTAKESRAGQRPGVLSGEVPVMEHFGKERMIEGYSMETTAAASILDEG